MSAKKLAGIFYYAYIGSDRITMERDGKVWYYHYDGHGNVRLLTDENGAVTDAYMYDAYGNLFRKEGTTANDFLYCAEQYNAATGLYYLRARYMEPATGTFISMDSYQGSIYDPVSLHKYLYANANPVKYIDPTGYYSMAEMSASMEMATILAGVITIMYVPVLRNIQTSMSTTPSDWRDYIETVPAERVSRPWIMTTPANILQEDLIEVFPIVDTAYRTFLLDVFTSEVIRDALLDIFPEEVIARELVEYASGSTVRVHGNSKASTQLQHGYEIYNTETGDVIKTGISGQKLNINGTSPRANSQVNRLNRVYGEDTYSARVVVKDLANRTVALQWEKNNALRLWKEKNTMAIHKRPTPWR